MGSAAERPVLIRDASAGFRLEQGAATVLLCGEFVYAALLQGGRCDERLASGEVRSFAGELELTTLGAPQAFAFHGALFKFGVHGFDRIHGFLLTDEFAAWFTHRMETVLKLEPFFAAEIK
jgi:hypothetical protein